MFSDSSQMADNIITLTRKEKTPRQNFLHAKARYYYKDIVKKLKENRKIFEYLDDEYRNRNQINALREENAKINTAIKLESKYEKIKASPRTDTFRSIIPKNLDKKARKKFRTH